MIRTIRGFVPSPLPDSIPMPAAEPPPGMDIVAVPTGVTKHVAAFGYRGGSPFERRDFNIGSVLIKHPRGDLLVDSGFGRDIDRQFTTMPRWFRRMTRYELWNPVRDQLAAAGYDFGRLSGILLTHAHWDHVSGLPDFADVPVLVSAREQVAFRREGTPGYFGAPFRDMSFRWRALEFDGGPYLGFPRSRDIHHDGTVVCVPAPGHTPGSVIVFVTLPANVRYCLVGDLVWQREGLSMLAERPALVRKFADWDADGTRHNLVRMASVIRRIPNMIIVPAHDQRAVGEIGVLPNITTAGRIP